jgi:hypothetical protein
MKIRPTRGSRLADGSPGQVWRTRKSLSSRINGQQSFPCLGAMEIQTRP